MTINPTMTDDLLAEFEQPWRGGSPIFACCRRAVGIALSATDLDALRAADATTRVITMRAAVEAELPGHLEGHRCCVGHLADLAFDLPDMVAANA